MSLWELLFGKKEDRAFTQDAKVVSISRSNTDCWWDHPEVLPLAAGRGFSFDVVGESYWQDNLSTICGGKCAAGHRLEVVAQLVFEQNTVDPNAVGVMIDSRPVGWIPTEQAAEFRAAITTINPRRRAITCKAKIIGGWERSDGDTGSFGVKLSLAWPLKIHSLATARSQR